MWHACKFLWKYFNFKFYKFFYIIKQCFFRIFFTLFSKFLNIFLTCDALCSLCIKICFKTLWCTPMVLAWSVIIMKVVCASIFAVSICYSIYVHKLTAFAVSLLLYFSHLEPMCVYHHTVLRVFSLHGCLSFPSSFPFLLIVGGIVTQQLFLPKQSSEKEQRLCCNHQEDAFGSKYSYKPNNEKWPR